MKLDAGISLLENITKVQSDSLHVYSESMAMKVDVLLTTTFLLLCSKAMILPPSDHADLTRSLSLVFSYNFAFWSVKSSRIITVEFFSFLLAFTTSCLMKRDINLQIIGLLASAVYRPIRWAMSMSAVEIDISSLSFTSLTTRFAVGVADSS